MSRKCSVLGLVVMSLFLVPVANAGDNPRQRPMKLDETGTVVSHMDPANSPRPWVFNADSTIDIPWETTETGTATHLGEFQAVCVGWYRVSPSFAPLKMWGDWTITADDGDTLLATIVWQEQPFSDLIATVTFHGGTGRFEQAQGTLNYVNDYTGEEWWQGSDHYSIFWGSGVGSITY